MEDRLQSRAESTGTDCLVKRDWQKELAMNGADAEAGLLELAGHGRVTQDPIGFRARS